MAALSSDRSFSVPDAVSSNVDAGLWGTEINNDLSGIDNFLGGTLTLFASASNSVTLSSAQAQIGNIVTVGSCMTLTFPSTNFTGIYRIQNQGLVTCQTSAGSATVNVPSSTPRLVSVVSSGVVFSDVPPVSVSSLPGPPGPSGPPGPTGPPSSPPSYASVGSGLANAFVSPSDPTGAASLTFKMMGLGSNCTITTSTLSGRMAVNFMFDVTNTSSQEGVVVQLYYGTGAAPANGAGATGTTLGLIKQHNVGWPNGRQASFMGGLLPTSLSVAYWFDLAVHNVISSTGTANLHNIDFYAMEY